MHTTRLRIVPGCWVGGGAVVGQWSLLPGESVLSRGVVMSCSGVGVLSRKSVGVLSEVTCPKGVGVWVSCPGGRWWSCPGEREEGGDVHLPFPSTRDHVTYPMMHLVLYPLPPHRSNTRLWKHKLRLLRSAGGKNWGTGFLFVFCNLNLPELPHTCFNEAVALIKCKLVGWVMMLVRYQPFWRSREHSSNDYRLTNPHQCVFLNLLMRFVYE